jgi:hypothetical protein
MEGNASGTGNGFAPPASFERRPGMPSPTSSVAKETATDLKNDNEPAKVGPTMTREERENETVHTLPKSKTKKSYSFVTEELEYESTDQSAGSTSEEN